jgi:catechol 2,3-dioxygenase-like lactoylglutathione lyase family enzyme
MNARGITPILNVSDVPASLRWFEGLGWRRGFTWNEQHGMLPGAADGDVSGPATFASVCSGEVKDDGSGAQIFLCHDGQGLRGGKPASFDGDSDIGAVWMSVWLGSPAEVDAAHALAVALGVTVLWPPTNEPWGVRECRIMHPDGHVFRLSAGLDE